VGRPSRSNLGKFANVKGTTYSANHTSIKEQADTCGQMVEYTYRTRGAKREIQKMLIRNE